MLAEAALKYYNNPKRSDITILLKSGEKIFTHKVILEQAGYFENAFEFDDVKEISFLEYDDEVVREVIVAIYSHTIDCSHMISSIDHWVKCLHFAHYIMSDHVINPLIANCPKRLAGILIVLGENLHLDFLIKKGIERMKDSYDKNGCITPTSIPYLLSINWNTYKTLCDYVDDTGDQFLLALHLEYLEGLDIALKRERAQILINQVNIYKINAGFLKETLNREVIVSIDNLHYQISQIILCKRKDQEYELANSFERSKKKRKLY